MRKVQKVKLWHFAILSLATISPAQQSLLWNRNSEADLASYNVYSGRASHTYQFRNAVQSESFSLAGITGTWYFAVTALDTAGNESAYSDEYVYASQIVPRPVTPMDVMLKGRGDSLTVSDIDTVLVTFRAINQLDDGTVVPETALSFQLWYRYDGQTTWFKVLTNPMLVLDAGKTLVSLPLFTGARVRFVVTTYYGAVESKAPKDVLIVVKAAAQWKTYQLKIII